MFRMVRYYRDFHTVVCERVHEVNGEITTHEMEALILESMTDHGKIL